MHRLKAGPDEVDLVMAITTSAALSNGEKPLIRRCLSYRFQALLTIRREARQLASPLFSITLRRLRLLLCLLRKRRVGLSSKRQVVSWMAAR